MEKESVGQLLKIASNQMIIMFDSFTQKFGLTGNQVLIIDYLFDHQDTHVYQKNIEKMLLVRRSTATGLLNIMEDHDLVKRTPDKHDARLKQLRLTKKALKIHDEIPDYFKIENDLLSKTMSKDEICNFMVNLNKVINVASKFSNNKDTPPK